MDEINMDEIKISDMDEPVECTTGEYEIEETDEADAPVYDDDDLSSIAMPVISEMDSVIDYTAVQYETDDSTSGSEDKFSQTGDGLDSVEMPVFSEMDSVAEGIAQQPEPKAAAENTIDSAAAPAADDMYKKPAESSSYESSKLDKPQPEKTEVSAEKTISAAERRMAEPFNMPGAYIPGEENQPSKYVPKPPVPPAPPAEQNDPSYVQDQPETRTGNNDDFLDNLYAERDRNIEGGKKKATILGTIVIVLAVFDFFSSIASSYSDNIDKIIAVATVVIMSFCAWKFIKGSNSCRRTIGIFSLFDAGRAFLSIFTLISAIGMLNKLFGTEISAAPFVFIAILKAIGFGVMAYFFLLDKQVSDYTQGD